LLPPESEPLPEPEQELPQVLLPQQEPELPQVLPLPEPEQEPELPQVLPLPQQALPVLSPPQVLPQSGLRVLSADEGAV
jgi:hypothetical protein